MSWLLHYCPPQQRCTPPCPMSILIVALICIIPLCLILHTLLVSKTFVCLLTQANPSSLLIQGGVLVHSSGYLYSLRSPLWNYLLPEISINTPKCDKIHDSSQEAWCGIQAVRISTLGRDKLLAWSLLRLSPFHTSLCRTENTWTVEAESRIIIPFIGPNEKCNEWGCWDLLRALLPVE